MLPPATILIFAFQCETRIARPFAHRAPLVMTAEAKPATPWGERETSAAAKPRGTRGDNQFARREGLVQGMLLPAPKGSFNPPLAADDPLAPLVYAIALAGDDRKARAIRAIRVSALTSITSFFVTMTGKTKTQVQSIGSNVRDEMREQFGRDTVPQGDPASGWVVLDYGDAICHIFTPEVKDFYELEKLWKNGQELALDGVVSAEGLSASSVEDEFDQFSDDEDLDSEIWGDDDKSIWG